MSEVYNITKFTMLDYQDHMSCIVWFSGCNMKCQYCHNPQIVSEKGNIKIQEIKDFIKSRVGKLEAVVLSGGEATLYKKLPEFAKYCKDLGFKVKLDTNGTNPKMVKQLVNEGLVDYIALDYKAPEYKFCEITACKLWSKFQETLNFLTNSLQNFEVRTTWHSNLLNESDIDKILADLNSKGYAKKFYLQNCNEVKHELAFATLPQSSIINAENLHNKSISVEIR